MNGRVMDLKCA